MYRFYINGIDDEYHYLELARVFLPDDAFEVIPYRGSDISGLLGEGSCFVNAAGSDDRDEIKREFYRLLSELTSKTPPWGTLTGVRPLKPTLEILKASSDEEMRRTLKAGYLMSDDKIGLISEIAAYQLANVGQNSHERASIYIGIPFCPTRCAYCSFASVVAPADEREEYLGYLIKETEYAGRLAKAHDTGIESIYIGGGTPTTLEADQLERLINAVSESFDIDPASIEFTVEAGRPDTITADKLKAIKKLGVSRISINPQSMKDETLRLIGRDHSADDIRESFAAAHDAGFKLINADIIAGLQGESAGDLAATLSEMIELGAENITVHTLSVKRGSRLKESDPEYYRRNTDTVGEMLALSRSMLKDAGYIPYYIYRQKHQIGSYENVGYCRPGTHSIYNIRIMEDKQTIIGLGAGAVGKVYYPDEDRLERIANVGDHKLYCERFDEMLARKDRYYY